MHATCSVRLSSVPGMSNVTVLLVEISVRCAPVPVCGLKKTYCEPFAPEMFPKSKTRDQFPFRSEQQRPGGGGGNFRAVRAGAGVRAEKNILRTIRAGDVSEVEDARPISVHAERRPKFHGQRRRTGDGAAG